MNDGIVAAIVVVFAGVVGYKIIKKKNPGLINKVKSSASGIGNKFSSFADEAKSSFAEGYARG
jgi:hypothetical protein